MSPSLGWSDLGCLRGGRILFEGLNGGLGPGEALLVRGPNGVGKSSLLRMLAGLLQPAAGTVERTGPIALADERSALDPRLALADALLYWARLDGRGRDDVTTALVAMDLEAIAAVPVRMLSTGQRKRATLARLVAGGQPIWLLDEPGNGLDAASLDRLAAAIAVHRAAGGIIVAATHQPINLGPAGELALA